MNDQTNNDQTKKAALFRSLHELDRPFLIPNPWDAGSARLLAQMGFQALATTSLGAAITNGVIRCSRDEVIANARAISEATNLPVTIDFENGFDDSPDGVTQAIRDAHSLGVVGASIEDGRYDPENPVYPFELAVERIEAAVDAARGLSSDFVLTARADNGIYGLHDLGDTIRRLQAYQEAGADVLYAPALGGLENIRTVVQSVDKPVNVVAGLENPNITLAQLAEAGVRRVSIGGGLCRLAMAALRDGAQQMLQGDFSFVGEMASLDELWRAFDNSAA